MPTKQRTQIEEMMKQIEETTGHLDLLDSLNKSEGWNDRKFAQRPANQTVAESLQKIHASRDYLVGLTSNMTDEFLRFLVT